MAAERRPALRTRRIRRPATQLGLRLVADSTRQPSALSRRSLSVVGMFAGVGGIELGLERAGHHARVLCEIDEGAHAVLLARFDAIERLERDIRELTRLPTDTDLLTAGFPCQDLSQAGMTAGIAGKSSGLIVEVLRLLDRRKRSRRPIPLVLLENVPFMLQIGGGRALDLILGQLEGLGYRWAYRVVNSLAFGVPQRRERVYLVAALDEDPRNVLFADEYGEPPAVPPSQELAFGFYWTEGIRGLGAAVDSVPTLKGGSTVGIPSPPAIVLPSGLVVTPRIEDAERMQGFPPGWTEPAERLVRRSHRWKLVGNAVTVNVAQWIGSRLATPGRYCGQLNEVPLVRRRQWPRAAWGRKGEHYEVRLSSWPIRVERESLADFLDSPIPLSERATKGFWQRLQRSSLRRPSWFDDAIKAHIAHHGKEKHLVAAASVSSDSHH